MNNKSVCIISPTYISSNPRVVKEANALHEAGFDVRVLFSQGDLETQRRFDKSILSNSPWHGDVLCWSRRYSGERFLYWKTKTRYHIARKIALGMLKFGNFAEYAEGRLYKELAKAAAAKKADIYIGHYPTGLAAAAYAASLHKTKYGYDIEDLHTEEHPDTSRGKLIAQRIAVIESRYISRCSHITAVSEKIADEIADRYKIFRPTVITNVFPWKDREMIDRLIKDRKGAPLSLYWFSQVVGLDRGIQDVLRACGILKGKVQIHIRGVLSKEVKNELFTLSKQCNIADNVYFHPLVSPQELLSRTLEHDIGLSLDGTDRLSKGLTLSNKFFLYLLAGLAVIATETRGHNDFFSNQPGIGFLYPSGDYYQLSEYLKEFLENPVLLRAQKEAALKASRERWNWEIEKIKLIDSVRAILM